MKIKAIGSRTEKRVLSMTIEAESEIEEAALYAHFTEICEKPPIIQPWYAAVVDAIARIGENVNVADVAEDLDIAPTATSNRIAAVYKMNLLKRTSEAVAEGGRRFRYSLNLRKPDETLKTEVLTCD
jgi:hypothetical protein